MVPVVLFTYNRPRHLKRVLEALGKNNIELLYIFSDGAKDSSEKNKVDEVRHIINSINWIEPRISKSEQHSGVAKSIIGGISEVLSLHNSVIVLEDDCLPHTGFYDYMCQCLRQYEKEEKVFCVSAYLPSVKCGIFRNYPYDVFFWGRFWSWGWGTWQRAWEKFNPDFMDLIQQIEARDIDTSVFGEGVSLHNLKRMSGYDTWATPFFLNMVLNKTLSVHPVRSYISNIGFDGSGVHCENTKKYNVHISKKAAGVPLRFTNRIEENSDIVGRIVDFINYQPRVNLLKLLQRRIIRKLK